MNDHVAGFGVEVDHVEILFVPLDHGHRIETVMRHAFELGKGLRPRDEIARDEGLAPAVTPSDVSHSPILPVDPVHGNPTHGDLFAL